MNIDFAAAEQRVMASMFDGLWMTSQEIADEVEKEHKHVMRDIRSLISDNSIDQSNFGPISLPDSYGRPQPAFRLDFFAAMLLVSGYDTDRRGAILKRWMELEDSQ